MTFRLLVKFDRRSMTPAGIHFYNDWSSLNYMYGVVNTSYHEVKYMYRVVNTSYHEVKYMYGVVNT